MDERDNFEPLRTRSSVSASMPTEARYAPQIPTPTASRRTFGLGALIGSAATTLALGVAIGYVAFHTSRAPASTPKSAPPAGSTSPGGAPATIVYGSLTLTAGAFEFYSDTSKDCVSRDGFSDISAGVAVTVGDQSGQTLAVGQLQAGKLTSDGNGRVCEFDFNVPVAGGKTLYTVTVSHRGTQTFTAEQVRQPIRLTLG